MKKGFEKFNLSEEILKALHLLGYNSPTKIQDKVIGEVLLNKDLIVKAAKETGAIVTAEEHSIIGGLGSAVSEVLCEEYPVPVVKVGIKDTFGESGKPAELLEKYGLTAANIVEKVKKAISLKK